MLRSLFDDSLKTYHFWKYVCNFERKYNSFFQLPTDNLFVSDTKLITGAFANHFMLPFNTNYSYVNPFDHIVSDFLPTAHIPLAEVSRKIKRLRPLKCIGLDGILSFIIKDLSDVSISLSTLIFLVSV
jgi:hypothetical protein